MSFSKALGVSLFLVSGFIGAGKAYAGFEYSYLGGAADSYDSKSANVQMDGTPIAKNTKTPSLQVFQEKYIPDSVRKKYNLKDDWYANGAEKPDNLNPAAVPIASPQSLVAPEIASENLNEPLAAQPVVSPVETPPAVIVSTWRARKGENLRDVLQRWSSRDETDLMWASPDSPILQKDFSFVGKYQDAINALIKEAGGPNIHSQYRSEGLSPVMMTPASSVTTNAPAPLPDNIAVAPKPTNFLEKVFEPEKKAEQKPETKWFGLSGAPLVEVIQVWSDDAGVRLIWQAERNIALKDSVSRVGKFEDAVFEALSQYDAESLRPVGEVYNDPKTGQQVLVVHTDVK